MQPIVVLVAEDVDVIREIVVDFLSEAGHCVIQVADAAQALEVLRESTCSPDLLFTDIKMPGAIDGIELARLASISWPNMKVLITSGHLRPTIQELPERSQFLPNPTCAKASDGQSKPCFQNARLKRRRLMRSDRVPVSERCFSGPRIPRVWSNAIAGERLVSHCKG